MNLSFRFLILLLLHLGSIPVIAQLSVSYNQQSPQLNYAVRQLEKVLTPQGTKLLRKPMGQVADIRVTLPVLAATQGLAAASLGPEDYQIQPVNGQRPVVYVSGGGEKGAMYGILDIAEQLKAGRLLKNLAAKRETAALPFRAIKYNLPYMAYRSRPANQLHWDTCRDLKYWEAFLDMMAENKFNVLTMWSLHPFHFMIRPKKYPEACELSDAELKEWQTMWTGLFRMAKERGIETYLVNWNIFVSPGFAKAHNVAPYSITEAHFGNADSSKLVEDYNRVVVQQVLEEYPDLTGLGITLGERMGGMSPEQRSSWLERTFYAGIAAAKRPVPAKFIYRAPLSGNTHSGGSTNTETELLTRRSIENSQLEKPVWVEFKYNWSHGHSSPKLFIVHGGELKDTYWNPVPDEYKVVWTVRNEDFYALRWSEPNFVREFLKNNTGKNYQGGCLIGSECYIPAKDYIQKNGPYRNWTYAFERQWLFYKTWGNLLYNPQTPDSYFADVLKNRFKLTEGATLQKAWTLASTTPLRFATFWKGTFDATIYTEGHAATKPKITVTDSVAYITLEDMIKHPVLDTNMVSISDFVHANQTVAKGKMSPLEVAALFEKDGKAALQGVAAIRKKEKISPTLACEMADIEAWSWMSQFIGYKIRAGVELASFRKTGNAASKQKALDWMKQSLTCWEKMVAVTDPYFNDPIPNVFDRSFSWKKYIPQIQKDIALIQAAQKE